MSLVCMLCLIENLVELFQCSLHLRTRLIQLPAAGEIRVVVLNKIQLYRQCPQIQGIAVSALVRYSVLKWQCHDNALHVSLHVLNPHGPLIHSLKWFC